MRPFSSTSHLPLIQELVSIRGMVILHRKQSGATEHPVTAAHAVFQRHSASKLVFT